MSRITVDITANVARFSSQLDRATQDLNRFVTNSQRIGNNLSSIFKGFGVGLSTAGFGAIIKNAIDTADNLRDLSKTTGIAVEQLAGLKLAATQSGTNLEDVANAVNKLSVNIGKNGDKFRELGITAKDPLVAFQQLADVFVSIEDPQRRAALAAAALGKSWQTTAPLLSEGGAAIAEMVKSGADLSGITQKMADNSDKFNDELAIMKARLNGVAQFVSGEILDGFNQLIDKIKEASGEVLTFNSVLTGIGNFAFNSDGLRTASVEIDKINDKIVSQKEKISAIKNNSFIGGLIDDIAGTDINLEKNRLDGLYRQREKIIQDFNDKQKKLIVQPVAAPSGKQVSNFIGADKGDEEGDKPGRTVRRVASSRRSSTIRDTLGEDTIKNLQREIALLDDTSRAAAAKYDTQFGMLSRLSPLQKEQIVHLSKELDASNLQQEAYDKLIEKKKEFRDLELNINELALSPDINLDSFNRGLAEIQDRLKVGIVTPEEAKSMFDILGKGFNENFVDPSKKGIDDLSEFAVQASHNLQNSLSNAISSGFKGGLDEMLVSFTKFLADAAANAASSQLLELFSGKDGKSGLLGTALTGLSGLFKADGGPVLPGTTYITGEVGAELFVPAQPGGPSPAQVIQSAMSGVNNRHVNSFMAHIPQANSGLSGLSEFPTSHGAQLIGKDGPQLFKPRQSGYILPNHVLKNMAQQSNALEKYKMPPVRVDGARASGGSVLAGKTYLIGEKGAEVFAPVSNASNYTRGGQFTSSSGNTYNLTIAVDHNGNESPDQLGHKIAEAFVRSIAREEIKSAARPGNTLNKVTSF